eukprot:Skav212687  [mRNA]  locus=scaffold1930:157494:166482:+ [translate_table: standard]
MDREQLQFRASEAQVRSPGQWNPAFHAFVAGPRAAGGLNRSVATPPAWGNSQAWPAVSDLTGVLAALLLPLADGEDLSDQIDFLALEALQLMCVLFRALGYASVTASSLMEFVNHDLLCLCSLLRGLFAVRADDSSLPHDTSDIQGVALDALCGLTAPNLAFPHGDGSEGDIYEQNRSLRCYLEVLGAAMVETGVLESAVDAALARCSRFPKEGSASQEYTNGHCPGAASGSKLIQFVASLLGQVHRIADKLGRLLEAGDSSQHGAVMEPWRRHGAMASHGLPWQAVAAQGFENPMNLRELVSSTGLCALRIGRHVGFEGFETGGF